MRLNKTLECCIGFAHFCRQYSFDPVDVAELITLTHRRANAEAKAISFDAAGLNARAHRRWLDVMEKAADMGLAVTWPGLYPSFTGADGREVRLPIA